MMLKGGGESMKSLKETAPFFDIFISSDVYIWTAHAIP